MFRTVKSSAPRAARIGVRPLVHRPTPLRRIAVFVATAFACTPAGDEVGSVRELLFEGAVLIDGTGAMRRVADVRIRGNRIVAIGDLEPGAREIVVDAAGLVLAPGFIDTHSHHDSGLDAMPDAVAATSQGITTIVVGQDGGSPFPLADFFNTLEETPAAVNVASYVGHNTLRSEIMADDFRREATREEIEAMRRLLERELAAGALGLSTGLEFVGTTTRSSAAIPIDGNY